MVRLALFGIVVILLILVARALFPAKSSSAEQEPTEMVMDPNNGVYIPKSEAIKKTINDTISGKGRPFPRVLLVNRFYLFDFDIITFTRAPKKKRGAVGPTW